MQKEPTPAQAASVGGRLFNWGVGAIAGILVVLTFGDRLYATKSDLNRVEMNLNGMKIHLETQGRQMAEMKEDQAVAFGKMETSIKRLEEILLSKK